jgi:hypothetical protein
MCTLCKTEHLTVVESRNPPSPTEHKWAHKLTCDPNLHHVTVQPANCYCSDHSECYAQSGLQTYTHQTPNEWRINICFQNPEQCAQANVFVFKIFYTCVPPSVEDFALRAVENICNNSGLSCCIVRVAL